MKIGFLGLGNMGGPMARNLLKAGHEVIGFDPAPAAREAFAQAGGEAVSGLQAIATSGADIIITMLPAAAQVREVYLGADGLLARAPRGRLFIDSSTIDPHSARAVAAEAARAGHAMLDAPVSGGTGGAEAGTLTFMVGGAEEDFARAKPVLAAMGRNLVHCGAGGNGQVAKIANNMLLGITMAGVAEAMALGVSLGMDPVTLAGIINTSSGRCWSSEVYNPWPGVVPTAPAARGYSGGFGTDLMLKDLGLATEAAKLARQPVPLGALAQQLYQGFSHAGHGGLDFSAIVRNYRRGGEA
ncbi:3-hydroxyisobutyrate dehydrogenase [Derxia gummosa]|uniref:3-hydroxyisobutyrate dehydrogenase n=1 Tax=Derxia gummosa DSM 723 TaxID=1121388 RepID=A0AC36KFP0_9BURK